MFLSVANNSTSSTRQITAYTTVSCSPTSSCPSKKLCLQGIKLFSHNNNLSQACSAFFFKGLLCLCLHLIRHKTKLKIHSARGRDSDCDACSFQCTCLCLRRKWLKGHSKVVASCFSCTSNGCITLNTSSMSWWVRSSLLTENWMI